jgi:Skp family chaperone for outer membrane proteins
MNRVRFIFAALGFVVLAAITAGAQTRPQTTTPRPTPTPLPRPVATPAPLNSPVPESRIALIDTAMFGDEKNGIFRYIDAANIVSREFLPRTNELRNLETRLNTLATEIQTLMKAPTPDQRAIQAKQTEGDRLQQEFNTKKDRLDEDVSKRYQQIVTPVSKQIGAAMDQFARQRGITMTLDISKLLPAILTVVPAVDITQAFIADFNSKNPRTASPPRP